MMASSAAHAIEIHGHRGARGVLPENTLPAFEHAIAVGADWLELDVGASKDGTIWVFHDRFLNDDIVRRDGTWIENEIPLISMTDSELAALDVGRIRPGSGYADRYPEQVPVDGTGLPRLADLFDRMKELGNNTIRFNIEIKSHPGRPSDTPAPEAFARSVLSVIDAAGVADRVLIQSFDWRLVREVMQQSPGMRTACLTAQQSWMDTVGASRSGGTDWLAGYSGSGSVPEAVKAAGCAVWSPFFRDLTAASLTEAHQLGLRVVVWTVNRAEDIQAMADLGVDGIISDYPERALKVIGRR